MAEIKSFPNNQSTYVGAEWVMRWLHGRTSGVFAAENNAAVAPVSGSMAVTVSDGLGWLANSEGNGIVWWNDAYKQTSSLLQLAIDTAHGSLNRIDRVIVEWKTTNYVDLPEIKILKGTAESNPSAPALTNNSSVRQISLARISVPAGTLAITAGMITDERLDPNVCGIVTESVTADTSIIHAQYEAALEELESAISEAWSGEISDGSISTEKLANNAVTPDKLDSSVFDLIYPVGSIYMSVNSTSPASLFGGTWERIKDRFLLSAGDNYSAGATGGASTVTLTSAQSGIPAHSHGHTLKLPNHTHAANTGGNGQYLGHTNDWNGRNANTVTNTTGDALKFGGSANPSSLPAISGSVSNNAAANAAEAHENMPPYLTVYMWQRTA